MTIRQTRRFLTFVIALLVAASLLQVGLLIASHGPRSSAMFVGSPLLFTVVLAANLRRLREREATEGPEAPFAPAGRSRKPALIVVLVAVAALAVGLAAALLLRPAHA